MKNVIDSNFKSQICSNTTSEEYERQIDQMIYKLYGLTPEEIKIAEKEL